MTAIRWVAPAVGVAAVALAFWGGTRVSHSSGSVATAPAVAPAVAIERVVVERSPGGAAVGGLTRHDIREIIRDELAERGAAAAANAEPRPSAAEVAAAVTAAHAAIHDGIERGVWGERERTALRPQLAHLSRAELHEVLSPLFQAINAQRLRLDGPPL